jgi:ABC-type uncharacterized transport system ATPase subunit
MLEIQDVSKFYPPATQALDHFSLKLEGGKMYALVGENGAGKSTLLKIISGLSAPSSGRILLDGKEITNNPLYKNVELGILLSTQELSLVPTFNAVQNTAIQRQFSDKKLLLDLSESGRKLGEIMAELSFKIDLWKRTSDIPLEDRQKLEVMRRLATNARVLMLDEPSTMLTPLEEEQVLFALKNLVKKSSLTVIITTHKFQNLLKYPDDTVVMRKGKLVLHDSVQNQSINSIIKAVTGEEPKGRIVSDPSNNKAEKKVLLETRNLECLDSEGKLALSEINIKIHSGEIVGLIGSALSGKDAIAPAILGMTKKIRGRVIFNCEDITSNSPRQVLDRGIGYIPKNNYVAVAPSLTVAQNLVLNTYYRAPYSRNLIMNDKAIEKMAERAVKDFNIKTHSVHSPVSSLSGGNQRKVTIAREIQRNSKLLIAEDPTIGLDIRTSQEVMNYLVALRNRGGGVLFVSEELSDVLAYSDIIYVLYEKHINKVLEPANLTVKQLGAFMLGLDNA